MNDLLTVLTELSGMAQGMILTGFLVFLRIGAMMALLPAFGEQTIPARVRLGVALAFTAIVAPAVADRVAPLQEAGAWPFLTEVAAGLLLGMALRLFVHALQIAGTLIAQATSLSQLFGGIDANPLPAVGTLLTIGGLALALASGLHVRVAEMAILSYDIFPAGRLPTGADVAGWGVGHVARMFALGFSIAAPFVVAALIYNLAMGVVNRAMPQLMVAFIGAPALTLGGLALMAVALPLGLALWLGAFNGFLDAPFVVRP